MYRVDIVMQFKIYYSCEIWYNSMIYGAHLNTLLSQLFAILTDFDLHLGTPKLAQTIQKQKKSEAKKSLKNRPPSEPPKMSFDYLWR